MAIEENDAKPEPVVTRPRRRWLLPLSLAALLILLFAGVFLRQNKTSSEVIKEAAEARETPVRLTDDPGDDSQPRWTSDGHIRFVRTNANDQSSSFIMNADGTGQSQVQDFANLKTGVWSPDGKKVIFQKNGDTTASYLANADGTNEVALPFFSGNFDWSFDSTQIVYQKTIEPNNSEIFVYSLSTRQSHNVTNHPAFDAEPSFSPDGKDIVFVSNRDENNEIYLVSADGSGTARRVTRDRADDSHPVFSPDGTAIAFTSDRKNESADVYLLISPEDAAITVPLTDWPSNETVEPGCWSPDGTKIAFYSNRNGKKDIYTIGADTFNAKALLSDPKKDLTFASYAPDGQQIVYQARLEDGTGELSILDLKTKQTRVIRKTETADSHPEWSPDGDLIAFETRVGDNTEICLIKPDGTGFRNLINNPANDVSPSWSPLAIQIAFVSNRGKSTQLFVMNADGTNQFPIESTGALSSAPNWGQPGGTIIFANDKEDNRTGNFELFSIEPNGGELKRLTFRQGRDIMPARHGKSLVFVSQLDGNSEIYFMYYPGFLSYLYRMTRNASEDLWPRWSPDGRRIVFSSNRTGKFALYEFQFGRSDE